MRNTFIQIKYLSRVFIHQLNMNWRKYGFKYLIIAFAGFLIYSKDVDFVLQLKNQKISNYELPGGFSKDSTKAFSKKTSLENKSSGAIFAKPKTEKEKRFEKYVSEFKHLAIKEKNEHGVPAAVTMAQALLETNGGKSKLVIKCNNHFGIKCFSRKCKKGHCHNFEDDSHKDFFRKYKSVEDSFRAHSLFLKKDRYKFLFQYEISDYESWCKGLRKAGYATDERYAFKLIALIKKYRLYELDNE